MTVKAVLFDLDGTLLDTLDDLADSANFALEHFGYPTHPVDAYRYFVGNGADNLIKAIVPEEARAPRTLQSMKEVFLERYGAHSLDKTRPYGGVPEMLAELKGMSFKLAVVSNKPDTNSKFTISRILGEGIFDVVAGGRSGLPLKPDPAIMREVLGALGVPPQEAVMVGDTSVDLAAAQNAGCASIGVLWGFRPEEAESANFVTAHPSELPEIIRKHFCSI